MGWCFVAPAWSWYDQYSSAATLVPAANANRRRVYKFISREGWVDVCDRQATAGWSSHIFGLDPNTIRNVLNGPYAFGSLRCSSHYHAGRVFPLALPSHIQEGVVFLHEVLAAFCLKVDVGLLQLPRVFLINELQSITRSNGKRKYVLSNTSSLTHAPTTSTCSLYRLS